MFKKERIDTILLGLAVIMIPFNAMPYLKDVFKELAWEGAFYPILLAMVVWAIHLTRKKSLTISSQISAKLLILFMGIIAISFIINCPSMIMAQNKGRTGIEKAVLQMILIVFTALVPFWIYDTQRNKPDLLEKIRFCIFISFAFAGLYSLIEIPFLVGVQGAETILRLIDPWVRDVTEGVALRGRLHSVSGEPSWFGMYCGFLVPWLLSYLFTSSKNLFLWLLIIVYLMIMVFLTASRMAYVVVFLEVLFFFIVGIVGKANRQQKIKLSMIIGIIVIIGPIVLMLFGNNINSEISIIDLFLSLIDDTNLSNIARYGSQVAAYEIANDYPIFGVGLGQYGFHMADYAPAWSLVSFEMISWMDNAEGTAWPPVHSIYARIAAELGYIGLVVWILLWGTTIYGCYKKYKNNTRISGTMDILGLSLIISIIGSMISGLNTDSFRSFGYWILIGLAWCYSSHNKKSEDGAI